MRRKVAFQGRELEGSEIPFNIVQDGAVVLECEDGAKLRVRPVIVNVLKTDEKTPAGDRLYIVQNLVTVMVDRPSKEEEH